MRDSIDSVPHRYLHMPSDSLFSCDKIASLYILINQPVNMECDPLIGLDMALQISTRGKVRSLGLTLKPRARRTISRILVLITVHLFFFTEPTIWPVLDHLQSDTFELAIITQDPSNLRPWWKQQASVEVYYVRCICHRVRRNVESTLAVATIMVQCGVVRTGLSKFVEV